MDSRQSCFICEAFAASEATSPEALAVAIPFRAPQFPGHTVVAPVAHRDLEDVTDAEWVAIGQAARRTSARTRAQDPDIEKCYLVAIGDADRGHLHFHILPKQKGGPSLGPFVFGESGWLKAHAKPAEPDIAE